MPPPAVDKKNVIKYPGGLEIPISPENERLGQFSALDKKGNGDGKVTAADFGGDESKLLDATCDVFFPSPSGAMTRQETGFRNFVGLYGRVRQFEEFTARMKEKHLKPSLGKELEFSEKDWPEVKRQMTGDGPFTPEKITEMAYDVRRSIYGLGGRPSPELPISLWQCSTNMLVSGLEARSFGVRGFSYDESSLPEFLRQPVLDVTQMYLKGMDFLRWYDEVECDDWGWDFCENTEINIGAIGYLQKIYRGKFGNVALRSCLYRAPGP